MRTCTYAALQSGTVSRVVGAGMQLLYHLWLVQPLMVVTKKAWMYPKSFSVYNA